MYKIIFIILTWLGCLSLSSQTPKIHLDAVISEDLLMSSKMVFENVVSADTLKIFKFSAGKNIHEKPNIKILNISINNQRASFKETEKWIFLGNTNEGDRVEITYQLDLTAIHDWRKSYGYQIFPGTYKDKCWYPDIYLDGKRDFHKDFEVEIQHDPKLQLLTSGDLISIKEKNKQTISSFKAENIRYFGLNAALDFVHKTITNGNVDLSYFCPKSKETEYKKVAKTAMGAINWYIKQYGFFPVKNMSIAIGHPKWHGGFPSENMFYIHQGNLEKSFVQWITAHELGHYYWGLHTLSATEDELSPLMLSNGIWIDHLYLSNVYKKSFTEIWNKYSPQAAMIEKYLATYLSNYEQEIGFTRPQQNFGFDYNSNVSHGKAAVGIYLLSQLIGFKEYTRLQKELLKLYKGKPLSINDFISFLESKGYANSKKFLNDWYKDHAFIEYGIYNIKTEEVTGGWTYTFEIRKKGTVDYPIDIHVIDALGSIHKHTTKANTSKEIITGTTTSKPVKFLVDKDGKVPMWNSDNNDIQRAYIFGLYRAGKIKIANQLAEIQLRKFPEDERLKKVYDGYSK